MYLGFSNKDEKEIAQLFCLFVGELIIIHQYLASTSRLVTNKPPRKNK